MPRAPKKCGKDGCEARVVAKPYCPDHQPVGWSRSTDPRYGAEHRVWRKRVLARARGLCEIRGPGCTHRATDADHVDRLGARYDLANGQAACPVCHGVKTRREAAEARATGR